MNKSIKGILEKEYGVVVVNNNNTATSMLEEAGIFDKTLIERVLAEVEGTRRSLIQTYAEAVSWTLWKSKSCRGYDSRKLFVYFRLNRLWDWTEREKIDDLIDLLKEADADLGRDHINFSEYPVWGVGSEHVLEMAKKGVTLHQMRRLLKLVRPMADRNENTVMSSKYFTYRNGIHYGEWLTEVVEGLRREHVLRFNTFMRVFKHTHKIATKITGRYLSVLEGLDDQTLKLTVTDSTNWRSRYRNNCSSLSVRSFRLRKIVRSPEEWSPLRLNHHTDKAWLVKFGRIPINQHIRSLDVQIIEAFTKKTFGFFVKEVKRLELKDEHNILAMAKIVVWFGRQYQDALPAPGNVYVYDDELESLAYYVHYHGIDLPNKPFPEGVKFILRYRHRWDDAVRVLRSWDLCIESGVRPLAKNGLEEAVKFARSISFEEIRDVAFAREAGLWTASQSDFEYWQDKWEERKGISWESIPKVSVSEGDWKFYRLNRDDPRGLFLGEYTGCCQHPDGQGSTCAWHGVLNGNGGFVVLEYRGQIKFQSWVWRQEDTLVFDNIEGKCNISLYEEAKEVYLKGIRSFKGKLEIKRLLVGVSHSSMKMEGPIIPNPVKLSGYSGFSDSSKVWDVTPTKTKEV